MHIARVEGPAARYALSLGIQEDEVRMDDWERHPLGMTKEYI